MELSSEDRPRGRGCGVQGAHVDARPELVSAAIEAIRQWRYTPTLLNCVAIEVPMKVSVLFRAQ